MVLHFHETTDRGQGLSDPRPPPLLLPVWEGPLLPCPGRRSVNEGSVSSNFCRPWHVLPVVVKVDALMTTFSKTLLPSEWLWRRLGWFPVVTPWYVSTELLCPVPSVEVEKASLVVQKKVSCLHPDRSLSPMRDPLEDQSASRCWDRSGRRQWWACWERGQQYHQNAEVKDECIVGCHQRSWYSDLELPFGATILSACRFCGQQSVLHLVEIHKERHATIDHCLTDRHVDAKSHSWEDLAGESSATPDCCSQAASKHEGCCGDCHDHAPTHSCCHQISAKLQ